MYRTRFSGTEMNPMQQWHQFEAACGGIELGLSQTFPDQCASRVRVWDDITFGCERGVRAAVFLLLVASMRVQQSATPLQIVPGKTLQQARSESRSACRG